jgi:N-acetylglutamate synthase-like GNAT family acetyltransferase
MTPAIGVLIQRAREEFGEVSGLQITVEEGVRFWALDAETCASSIDEVNTIAVSPSSQNRYSCRRILCRVACAARAFGLR